MSCKGGWIFVAFFFIALVYALFYGLQFDTHHSSISLSSTQIENIARCKDNLTDENIAFTFAPSNLVCYPERETKRDIVLLSTYPVTGGDIIRRMYESATFVSSYSQYVEGGSHRRACDFQTGPWKLYCSYDREISDNECKHQHPPPKNVPYFVNTNYPIYSTLCEEVGYPLPRHERIVHIVRNPVDNIEALVSFDVGHSIHDVWSNRTIGEYVEEYENWHTYWMHYHEQQPEIPTLWLRYEDLCLCLPYAVEAILEFTHTDHLSSSDIIKEITSKNSCHEAKQVGKGLSYFSENQLHSINDQFSSVIEQFGYRRLMNQFVEQLDNQHVDVSDKRALFFDSLWSDLTYLSHPSASYCRNLLATEWEWGNKL